MPTKLTASTETLKLRADSSTDFEVMTVLSVEPKKTYFHYSFANYILQSFMENRLCELLYPEMVPLYKW